MWKRKNITIRLVDNSAELSTKQSTGKRRFSTTFNSVVEIKKCVYGQPTLLQKHFRFYTEYVHTKTLLLKRIKDFYTNPQTLLRLLRYLYINNLLNRPVENTFKNEDK